MGAIASTDLSSRTSVPATTKSRRWSQSNSPLSVPDRVSLFTIEADSGSAKFDRFGVRVNSDTSGYRAETAVPVALGESAWFVVPGLEYERMRTQDSLVRWTTNRFFINFLHSSRR